MNAESQKIINQIKPQKYVIYYRSENGSSKWRRVSGPININKNTITFYSHREGVRSFRKDRIEEIEVVQ